jgi:VWFA-related protein
MKIFLVAALVMAAFSGAAQAQTQAPAAAPPAAPGDQPSFKAAGEEVVLDVVVRDKKGRMVKDLKESNFTVIDNGEARPVKSFRIVEGTEAISASGARTQLDPLRQLRLITLVFQGGDQNAKILSRSAAMELIKGELAQNVYISVMAIDHRLQAIQPFTNDRELLKKAINRATASVNDYTNDTLSVKHDLEQMLGPVQGGDTSDQGRLNGLGSGATSTTGPGAAPTNAGGIAMAQLMLTILHNAQADETTDWSRGSIFPLLDLVKEQYLLPGRKTILYFSGGFPISQSTEDPFKTIISLANRANVSFYAVDTRGLTTYSTNSSSVDGIRNAAGATMGNVSSSTNGVSTDNAKAVDYAIDAGKSDTQNAIAMLSSETGGMLIANTNDFRAPIRKVTEDIQSYYEITYDPQIQKYDGAFRKVLVKTDIADLKVQSRAGYFALPPNLVNTPGGSVLASYEVPLLKALDETPLAQNFNFQSAAMHFRTTGGSTCEVVVDIPVGGLTFEENKTAGYFEGKLAYVAVVKDASGAVVKKLRQEVPMRVTPDKIEAYKAASHFIYNEGFDLPPGHYTLETAVIDMTSQKVSARKQTFDVPDNGSTLGMSSAIFVRSMKAKDPATKPDDPMVTADGVLGPSVSPVIKKTEDPNLHFYVTIYPDKKSGDKPKMKMEFSKDGKLLAALDAPPPGAPDAQGRIQYPATIPDGGFPPGTYTVRFVAQQGAEKAAAEPVSFTIQ